MFISVQQCSSVFISVHQCSSVLISDHPCSSVLISAHQCSSAILSDHQCSSVLFSALQCSLAEACATLRPNAGRSDRLALSLLPRLDQHPRLCAAEAPYSSRLISADQHSLPTNEHSLSTEGSPPSASSPRCRPSLRSRTRPPLASR